MAEKQQKHFVLVHGIGHGAWCWYKLQPLLEADGHLVTLLDLSASGIDLKSIDELRTFPEYTQPLFNFMKNIPAGEKVVLVGHSLAGLNLAFVMEKYPEKISVAIFLAAMMPDTTHKPSYVLEQYLSQAPAGAFLDSIITPFGPPEDGLWSVLFGPQYLAENLYPRSPPEDLALAKTLVRACSYFLEDLKKRSPFSNEKFGSVKRAFIIAGATDAEAEFYRWEIENLGVPIVKEMEGADHMAMISKPILLFQYLLEIAK